MYNKLDGSPKNSPLNSAQNGQNSQNNHNTKYVLNFDDFANSVPKQLIHGNINAYNRNSLHIIGKEAAQFYNIAVQTLNNIFPQYKHVEFIPGGGTQANRRAILGSVTKNPKFISQGKKRNIILISSIEHTSILNIISTILKDQQYIIISIPCDNNGVISYEELEKLLQIHNENIALVSIMNTNNETGIIQNTEKYAELIHNYKDIIFHSDVSQGVYQLWKQSNETDSSKTPDIVSFSGYKVGGPHYGVILSKYPLLTNEYFGTDDVKSIYILTQIIADNIRNYIQTNSMNGNIKQYIIDKLNEKMKDLQIEYKILTNMDNSVNNAVCLLVYGYQSSVIQQMLSDNDICIGTGSACQSLKSITAGNINNGSHVIKEMGYTPEISFNLLRITWGEKINILEKNDVFNMQINSTKQYEYVNILIDNLFEILKKLKSLVTIPKQIYNYKSIKADKSDKVNHTLKIKTITKTNMYKLKVSIGESYLKGNNRNIFINHLINDINFRFVRDNILTYDSTDVIVKNDHTHITINVNNSHKIIDIIEILKFVPGISLIVPVEYFEFDMESKPEDLINKIYDNVRNIYKSNETKSRSICIRTNLHNKKVFNKSATDMNIMFGQMLVDEFNAPVSLKNPDIEFSIAIYDTYIDISTERYRGLSGLPLKSIGTVDVIITHESYATEAYMRTLLASIKLAKRGVNINIINNMNLTEESIKECGYVDAKVFHDEFMKILRKINPYVIESYDNNYDNLKNKIVVQEGFNHTRLKELGIQYDKYFTSITSHLDIKQVKDELALLGLKFHNIKKENNIYTQGFISMISGGIDSPVATHLINEFALKTHNKLKLIHFATSIDKIDVVKNIRNKINKNLELIVVEFGKLQFEIAKICPENYRTILFKTFMVKIANIIAKQNNLSCVVMGNSIGQVASQTYENLSITDKISELPIYNPLMALSKDEIIELAENKCGTYSESICTGTNDCCVMYLPKHPVLTAEYDIIQKYLNHDMFKNVFDFITVHTV